MARQDTHGPAGPKTLNTHSIRIPNIQRRGAPGVLLGVKKGSITARRGAALWKMDVLNIAVRLPHWAAIMREEAISEKTPVRLGLLIIIVTTALGLIFGGASGLWWWASWSSKVDTKLNNIETLITTMGLNDSTRGKQLDDVERRVMRLETVGSPAVQQIQKDVSELLRKFDMHMAKEKLP